MKPPASLRLVGLWLALSTWLAPAGAAATPRVYALSIGNNAPLTGSREGSAAGRPLRFADDDAAAFHSLVSQIAKRSILLSVLDDDTQGRYPELVAEARVPSRSGVEAAVAELAEQLAADRAAGRQSSAFVFFSGHGAVDSEQHEPALALFDGGLSQSFLYDRVLARLPADRVHVLVDACHAEAIVRPRNAGAEVEGDIEAEVVGVTPEEAHAHLVRDTLRRFPHVGAIVAATTGNVSHEWDALGHGIFTYELLSALRGAADVNRDRRVEYSEVVAFMSAANREIADPRARLSVVARPPEVDRRASMLQLSAFPPEANAWLSGVPGAAGKVELEDERGQPLMTLHLAESDTADVLVPTGATVFVRRGGEEARLQPPAGRVVAFESLRFAEPRARSRGGFAEAVRRGLFSGRFGRSYYQGFVDHSPGFLSVAFDDAGAGEYFDADRRAPTRRLVALGGLSNTTARSLSISHGAKLGLRPGGASGLTADLELVVSADGPLEEWRGGASAGWLQGFRSGPIGAWVGGGAGAGFIAQKVDGAAARATPTFFAGPVLGLSTQLGPRFGTWSELGLSVLAQRRDDELVVALTPSAWLGASVGF